MNSYRVFVDRFYAFNIAYSLDTAKVGIGIIKFVLPDVGFSIPMRSRASVLFPEPLSP